MNTLHLQNHKIISAESDRQRNAKNFKISFEFLVENLFHSVMFCSFQKILGLIEKKSHKNRLYVEQKNLLGIMQKVHFLSTRSCLFKLGRKDLFLTDSNNTKWGGTKHSKHMHLN